jgi:hypothetical protein
MSVMIGALFVVVGMLGAPAELNDRTFEDWRDFIRPSAQELGFLEIPWRDSFHTAVKEALKTDRPILLWAMNGHPLGCT